MSRWYGQSRERLGDAILLALEMEEGTNELILDAGKSKGTDSPLEPPEESLALLTI